MLSDPETNLNLNLDLTFLACKMQILRIDARLEQMGSQERNFHLCRNMLAHQRDALLVINSGMKLDPKIFADKAISSLAHRPVDKNKLLIEIHRLIDKELGRSLLNTEPERSNKAKQ